METFLFNLIITIAKKDRFNTVDRIIWADMTNEGIPKLEFIDWNR
ncbi:MAG: hypothetical protein ACFFB5_24325 [Promethearchaeota archaeon]